MNRFIKLFAIGITLISSQIAFSQDKGTTIDEYIDSEGIKKNIFGDTTKPKVIVYLPPSYYDSDKRFPVLYYLTGSFTEVDHMFNGSTPHIMNQYIDSLIHNKVIEEYIVAVATTKLNITKEIRMPTMYINSPVNGDWEDFIVNDLIKFIDGKYRTIDSPESRGLTGHSMGGHGTIRLALLHPDKFGFAYSMAYGMDNPNKDLGKIKYSDKQLYRMKKLYELKMNCEGKSFEEGMSIFLKTAQDRKMVWPLALGTSFRPRIDNTPPFFHIPIKSENDSIFYDNDYAKSIDKGFTSIDTTIKKYLLQEKRLLGLAIENGLYDGEDFIYGAHYTSERLIDNKIPHQMIYTEYGHINGLRYQVINYMLPYFSKHLKRE